MLDLSPDKLFMLAVVAMVVLGPNRLPQAARSVGRLVGQMRAMSSTLQSEIHGALSDPEDAFSTALAEFRPGEVRRSVRRAITDTLAPFDTAAGRRTTNETSQPAHVPAVADPFAAAIPAASTEVGPRPAGGEQTGFADTPTAIRPSPDDPTFN